MKEIEEIIQAFDVATSEGKRTALATVVHVEGSSYRRPGARMLITEEGRLTGAISGGCLEGDALRKALLVMQEQRPMVVTYDTSDEDDAKLGVGLGCNGIIQILIEPVLHDVAEHPIQILRTLIHQRQKAVLVTVFSLDKTAEYQPGTYLSYMEDGTIKGTVQQHHLYQDLLQRAVKVMEERTSQTSTYLVSEKVFTAFVEYLPPKLSLIIVGAGNDARPLTAIAKLLGWTTTVVDGRPHHAAAHRFPDADKIIIAKPEEVVSRLYIDEQTVIVLMTHNYNYDLRVLKDLVGKRLSYIGLLGPKKRLDMMMNHLREEQLLVEKEIPDHIYGPVGLDIGAETAEEIALSIVSEIKAVLSKRSGMPLRNKQEPIHQPSTTKIAMLSGREG